MVGILSQGFKKVFLNYFVYIFINFEYFEKVHHFWKDFGLHIKALDIVLIVITLLDGVQEGIYHPSIFEPVGLVTYRE